ncbi:uncharacterized protein G2W53_007672 [Senna tora]|uniref:Uncharacterized protein n=1 Tax=Senna tora TaxID=362788 RepID=A0A835CG03_9FABA|nr:uncharacterized protein G2W53_007672 [Senna tora]
MFGSQKPSRITRQKTCCASESNTSVRVVFANKSGFDAPIAVDMAWEERGSCTNIFRTTNHDQISETFTNYEAKDLLRKRVKHVDDKSWTDLRNLHELRGKRLVAQSTWHGRSVDHVLTYSGRQIVVGSQKPSRIMRKKTSCASESNTSVRVVFANRSGSDAPIAVVLAWEERGSCFNLFRTTNRGRITETFTNYEAEDLLRKRQIALGSQKPSRIMRKKTCCTSESNTSVRVVFANRSGFDAPIGTWHGRSVDHALTYSGRQIVVGSQKPSRITRQKTCCASQSNMSDRVVFANRSGFDATIGVVLAWEERGSWLNIFHTTNRGRISESFMNYEAKDLLRK